MEGTENDGAPYGFAVFNKDEQELLDKFNAGLKDIVADGTYEKIIAKYLGDDAAASAAAAFETEGTTEGATE